MGERAKVILNEYSAKNLLMRDTLDLDKFYTADLKLFVEVARKEIERLQEENLLLKASEPMSKLAEDYGYKAETERLNNIINNLNNGIKELDNMFYETFRISQNGYYSISEWELKGFTDKLQELKGVDKE